MRAAVQEGGVPTAEARLLLAHLEFGARALVNTGGQPKRVSCPVENARFEPSLAEDWNHMTEVEDLFDAISNGDLALLGSLLHKRLLPHAELMSHALAESLDPLALWIGATVGSPSESSPSNGSSSCSRTAISTSTLPMGTGKDAFATCRP
jgi:hypothetical protein